MSAKTAARIVVLGLLLTGIVLAAVFWSSIDPVAIRNAVAGNKFSPVIFIGLQIVASLLFVPRTVLGIAAGLLFGIFWGSVWAIIGAVAGAAAGFAIVRWFGVEGSLDRTPRIGALIQRAEAGGWRAVALLRLSPLPHSVANTALALTALGWRDYLVGSSIGMLPTTLAQVDIGASGGALLDHGGWLLASVLLALGLAGSLALRHFAGGRK